MVLQKPPDCLVQIGGGETPTILDIQKSWPLKDTDRDVAARGEYFGKVLPVLAIFIKTHFGHPMDSIIPHTNIIASEIFEDGETLVQTKRMSQIGGAVVSGLVLGRLKHWLAGYMERRYSLPYRKGVLIRQQVLSADEPVCVAGRQVPADQSGWEDGL